MLPFLVCCAIAASMATLILFAKLNVIIDLLYRIAPPRHLEEDEQPEEIWSRRG
jgi:hypothetical protein